MAPTVVALKNTAVLELKLEEDTLDIREIS